MQLSFTVDQFFNVFRNYNIAVWPAQVLLNLFAIVAVIFAVRPLRSISGKVISLILAVLWLWIGLAYHLVFFSSVNSGAYFFSILSVVGSVVFIWDGVIHDRLKFQILRSSRSYFSFTLILFALLGYPAWLYFSGHYYPMSPTFGLPCPTTIFTIGILGLSIRPIPLRVIIVPIVWSIIGVQAAFLLNIWPDLVLGVAGAFGILFVLGEWFEAHLNNWGSTFGEQSMHFSGEEFLRDPKIESTHAITIHSKPEYVWPWLLQMGQERGGFYSHSWLENLAGCNIQNSYHIVDEWQNLQVGDSIVLHPKAPKLRVNILNNNQTLSLNGWIFHLIPINNNETRLLTRLYFENKPELGRFYNFAMNSLLFKFCHFVMGRRQLMKIKELCMAR